jgi:hypothetical protein
MGLAIVGLTIVKSLAIGDICSLQAVLSDNLLLGFTVGQNHQFTNVKTTP